MVAYHVVFLCLLCVYIAGSNEISEQCHDPSLGGHRGSQKFSDKKFLLIAGAGAGIGNFLVFFPAAFYFAALTGREILLTDASIIGEMCTALHCGFPLYSEMSKAYPSVLTQDLLNNVRGAKVGDFHKHMNDPNYLQDKLIRADGYLEQSGWYYPYPLALDCVSQISGCGLEDFSCHDRHALQQLVRGPFKSAFSEAEEKKIIGVPQNFKHGILTLPHKYAPRLDAAVHLRCQFQHFEWLVGKDDGAMWTNYQKEVDDWLNSKDGNKGQQLFREVEQKIMAELHIILEERMNTMRRRRLLVQSVADIFRDALAREARDRDTGDSSDGSHRRLEDGPSAQDSSSAAAGAKQLLADLEHEKEVYHGTSDRSDRVYVYLAADNELVKEAFAEFLLGHHNISVMRVRTEGSIVHAKNTGYLRQTADGVMALAVDWYALSLANIVFAWRRDTAITSTFARSAQKVSGNSESIFLRLNSSAAAGGGAVPPAQHAKMFQLNYGRNGNAVWAEH